MRKMWTADNVEELREHYKSGMADSDIGKIMGRTSLAITIKRAKVGFVGAPKRISNDGRLKMSYWKQCGAASKLWKGGRRINTAGYVEIHRPDHHRSRGNGYVFEHILVVEEHLGRQLTSKEIVHHIDGNKQNNTFVNLAVMSQKEHASLHSTTRHQMAEMKCPVCGRIFFVTQSQSRCRVYCSQSCQAKIVLKGKRWPDGKHAQSLSAT